MTKPTTTRDMRIDVRHALASDDGDFDVAAIVDEIHAEHGVIDIDDLPTEYFWGVVAKHDHGLASGSIETAK